MCEGAGQDHAAVPGAIAINIVNKSMNMRPSAMLVALSVLVMLVQFKLWVTNSTISYLHEVPGYSVSQTEPPSLQRHVSTES